MSGFTRVDLLVVIGYFIIIAFIGWRSSRLVKSAGDYFAGGRRFNKWLMAAHSLGTGTHADDPVGVAGAVYQRGISGIWYTYSFLFLTPFYWIIAPVFRRLRLYTTADFFQARYGTKMAVLYAAMGMLTFMVNTGTLLKGTGAIATAMTGGTLPEWIAMAAMTVVFVAYGTAGGLVATVFTEFLQALLIVVMSFLLVPYGLAKIGGFAALHDLLPADKFSFAAPEEITVWWIVAASVMNLIGIVGQPHSMEVCATGKTEWEGRVGFTYGNFVKRFCAMGWAVAGLVVIAVGVSLTKREDAFGYAIREFLPPGATGLMFAAILAAQMSTLSAFMVAGSALFSSNFWRRFHRPQADDRELLRVGRWSGLLVVAGGFVVAMLLGSVVDGLTIFWQLTAMTGLFMWAGVLWRGANRTGAWVSFVVMALPWLYLGQFGQWITKLGLMVPGLGLFADKAALPLLVLAYLPLGVVALVVGSLLGRPEPKKALDDFYTLIRTPVGREKELAAAGVQAMYTGESEGHPWELHHGRLVNVLGFLVALAFAAAILGLLWALMRIGA